MTDVVSILAIAAIAGTMVGGADSSHPIRLQVDSEGSASIIRVIADGSLSCAASYELTVAGNSGGNRSVNRGTVRPPARGPVAVATVRPRGSDAGTTATLNVSPCGGKAYQQVWRSDDDSVRS